MKERLDVESEELAAALRAAPSNTQRRVAMQMAERALTVQEPPLDVPDGLTEQQTSGERAPLLHASRCV